MAEAEEGTKEGSLDGALPESFAFCKSRAMIDDTAPVVLTAGAAASSGVSPFMSTLAFATGGALLLGVAAPIGGLGSKSTSVKSPRAIQLSSTFFSDASLQPSLQWAMVCGIFKANRAAKTLPSSDFIFSN